MTTMRTREDHQESLSKLMTLDDFVKYAKENQGDPEFSIEDVFQWATVEALYLTDSDKESSDDDIDIIETIDLIKALIKAKVMDVDERAEWPGDNHEDTTWLLSAAEFRDAKLVSDLLKHGADVNAKTAQGYGILDAIILGHDVQSDKRAQARVIQLIDIIMPYKPKMKLQPFVTSAFMQNEWPGFKKNARINAFVQECIK